MDWGVRANSKATGCDVSKRGRLIARTTTGQVEGREGISPEGVVVQRAAGEIEAGAAADGGRTGKREAGELAGQEVAAGAVGVADAVAALIWATLKMPFSTSPG